METFLGILGAIVFVSIIANHINNKEREEQVRTSFLQINAKQMEAQKSRRPVGFTTNSQTVQNTEKQ